MRRGSLLSFVLVIAAVLSCTGTETKIKCTTNEDCLSDSTVEYVCDLAETRVCLRSCVDDDTCLASQSCDIATGSTSGVCRDDAVSTPDGADSGGDSGGDPAPVD